MFENQQRRKENPVLGLILQKSAKRALSEGGASPEPSAGTPAPQRWRPELLQVGHISGPVHPHPSRQSRSLAFWQ